MTVKRLIATAITYVTALVLSVLLIQDRRPTAGVLLFVLVVFFDLNSRRGE